MPVLVDLRAQLAHYSGNKVQLGRMVETFFQEIDDCRPMVLMVMGQGYGWVPDGFSSAVSHLYPWVRHHNNPALPRKLEKAKPKSSLLGAMKGMLGDSKKKGKGKKGNMSKVLEGAQTSDSVDAERPVRCFVWW